MGKPVKVFYDYVCPYCYIGIFTAKRLLKEFDLTFEWIGWQIHSDTPREGKPRESMEFSFNLKRLAYDQNLTLRMPPFTPNTHLPLQGAEYAKDKGLFPQYHDAVFDALWVQCKNIGDEKTLNNIAGSVGLDAKDFIEAIRSGAYEDRVYDDEQAEKADVQYVPTFVFGGHRIVGNIPYSTLWEAVKVYILGYDSTI
ncbi:MAG: DsbA family protein [Candidatus Bathyarchaeia archaeon]